MNKVLYINGNPQKESKSYSSRVGNYYLEQLKEEDKNVVIDVVNVYEQAITLIDEDVLDAWAALGGGIELSDLTEDQQDKVATMGKVLEQFKEADAYVVVTPLWNFSIPPMLKAYLDNVVITGQTFKYTDHGPVGLLEDKKATIIQASGGVYSSGPGQSMEFASNYLEKLFAFLGVDSIDKILVEGVAMPDKTEEDHLSEAYKKVDTLFEFDRV